MASYRAARWARRNPGPATAAAAGAAAGVAAGSAGAAEAGSGAAHGGDGYASRLRPDAPPPVEADGESGTGRRLAGTAGGAGAARLRNAAEADGGAAGSPRRSTCRREVDPGPARATGRAPPPQRPAVPGRGRYDTG